MRILIGLTDLCPTEEDIEVIELGNYPCQVHDKNIVWHISNEDQLREWAYENYEIHRIVEV